ncbi:MAG: hypothetical protein Kow00109_16350 [Acidobacteriota bacterium]
MPPPTAPLPRPENRPVKAALCALIPGIGAVYNGEYTKAVVHFAVFAGLVVLAESEGIFGMAAASFYIFMIIDAYRSAEAAEWRRSTQGAGEAAMNFPIWGGVLILMGVVLLLDNLGAISLRAAARFWPLILVALGVYLLLQYFHGNGGSRTRHVGSGPPAEPPAHLTQENL